MRKTPIRGLTLGRWVSIWCDREKLVAKVVIAAPGFHGEYHVPYRDLMEAMFLDSSFNERYQEVLRRDERKAHR